MHHMEDKDSFWRDASKDINTISSFVSRKFDIREIAVAFEEVLVSGLGVGEESDEFSFFTLLLGRVAGLVYDDCSVVWCGKEPKQ